MDGGILKDALEGFFTYKVIGIILLLFFIGLVVKLVEEVLLPRKIREKKRSKNTEYLKTYAELEDLKKMNERDFEYFVAELFSNMGYKTNVVGGSGDGGIDVVAKKDGVEHYIQCKRYNNKSVVSVSQVRDFLGAIVSKRTEGKGFIVTTNIFSLDAERFAEDKPIELIDGYKLIKMVKEKKGNIKKEEEIKKEKCPECNGILLKKSGKHGFFLGCSNFPKCRYTKSF